MKILVNEELVKDIKFEAFDGKVFDKQIDCEEYEQSMHFIKKYKIENEKSELIVNAFLKFFKQPRFSSYSEYELLVLKYNKELRDEFLDSVTTYIRNSFRQTTTYFPDEFFIVQNLLKNCKISKNEPVLVYFAYESDYEGKGHNLEIEILGVSQFFKKLKTHRDELESIIDETAEAFKLTER